MDRYIIHNTVEYINHQPEFPFDVSDVEESLGDVLAFFGLHPNLSSEEEAEIKKELQKRALNAELAEMSRLMESGGDCYLTQVMAKLRPYCSVPFREPSVSAGEFVQRMRP